MADYGKIAAAIHKAMCNDSRFGYTMDVDDRWGNAKKYGYLKGTTDGVSWQVPIGDYDCSSSYIRAWRAALAGTKYAHMLDGAVNTSTIEKVFLASGLFEKKPMSFLAEPGDAYLKAGKHVAMCQTQYPDVLSEFSQNERGGAYGGKVGDQTGREAYVHAYYDYPWACIIHYNGKLDSKTNTKKPAATKTTNTNTVKAKLIDISHHNASVNLPSVKKAGYHVILKVGPVYGKVDPRFLSRAKECEKLGIPYGVFYYGYAKTEAAGKKEAQQCINWLKGRKLSYPVYYDSEEPGTQSGAGKAAKGFCTAIEKAGYWAGIYASESWWKSYLLPVVGDRYTKWVAKVKKNDDGKAGTKPSVNRTDIWQYSWKGKVPGVNGNVDVNYAYRDLVKAVTGKKAPY